MIEQITQWFEIGSRQACGLVLLHRATLYYRSHAKDRSALKMRLRDLAMRRVRFGYLRLTVMLKREGWAVGKKLVYGLYRELGLQMRTKKRKEAGQRTTRAGAECGESEPAMVNGLYHRPAGERAILPDVAGGGSIHSGMPGLGSGPLVDSG